MSNVEYDLDTRGGLMSQVFALVAPPPPLNDESKAKKREGLDLHPYYKRPGKGHNRDTCDACQEGGNLLCCDRCPASFHFICVDPPIEEEKDIPLGGWVCNKCTYELQKNQVEDNGENATGIVQVESESEAIGSVKSGKGTNKGKSKTVTSAVPTRRELRAKEREEKNIPEEIGFLRNAFQTFIKSAERDNPKEFSLPREFHSNFQFPGTDRVVPAKVVSRRSSGAKRKPYEIDTNGNVPLPAKCCFVCRKSCRFKKMIPCDYCPLYFHLDCLDPPLACRPDRNWMCPNHNQPFLEHALLKNDSYTERVKLWEKFSLQPVDQHTVKLDFFRTAHRARVFRQFRIRSLPRCRAQVPESVKAAYDNPPRLLPALQELIRLKSAVDVSCCSHCSLKLDKCQPAGRFSENIGTTFKYHQNNISEKEQELWLSSVLQMQLDYAEKSFSMKEIRESDENNFCLKPSLTCDSEKMETDDHQLARDLVNINGVSQQKEKHIFNNVSNCQPSQKDTVNGYLLSPCANSTEIDSKEKSSTASEDEKKKLMTLKKFLHSEKVMLIDLPNLNSNSNVGCVDLPSLSEMKNEDIRVVTQQHLEQLVDKKREHVTATITSTASSSTTDSRSSNSSIYNCNCSSSSCCSSINSNSCHSNPIPLESVEYLKVSSTEKDVIEKMRQLNMSSAEDSASQKIIITSPVLNVKKQIKIIRNILSDGVYVLVAPIGDTRGPVLPIHRNSVTSIGNYSSCDIDLKNYGHCNCVSGFHAVIYFNKLHQKYELVNYSQFGSIVNNVRFGVESFNKEETETAPSRLKKTLFDIFGEKRVDHLKKLHEESKLGNKVAVELLCQCNARLNEQPSWEGPAYLAHGSHIQFGCLEFVFTVVQRKRMNLPPHKSKLQGQLSKAPAMNSPASMSTSITSSTQDNDSDKPSNDILQNFSHRLNTLSGAPVTIFGTSNPISG